MIWKVVKCFKWSNMVKNEEFEKRSDEEEEEDDESDKHL